MSKGPDRGHQENVRMADGIATLLTRNLHEVFGADDPERRRATIDEIFAEDAVFYEPEGVHRGREALDQVAGAIRAAQPGLRYSPLRSPEEMHGVAWRIQWVAGHPSEAPAYVAHTSQIDIFMNWRRRRRTLVASGRSESVQNQEKKRDLLPAATKVVSADWRSRRNWL